MLAFASYLPTMYMAMFNLDFIYPIGSIYINVNDVDPTNLFGGTWERVSQGRCLIGAGRPIQNNDTNHGSLTTDQLTWDFSAGHTIGEYSHKLNGSEMPKHSHGGLNWAGRPFSINSGTTCIQLTAQSWSTGDGNANYWWTGEAGGDNYHNNVQPSLVVYMWKRTA